MSRSGGTGLTGRSAAREPSPRRSASVRSDPNSWTSIVGRVPPSGASSGGSHTGSRGFDERACRDPPGGESTSWRERHRRDRLGGRSIPPVLLRPWTPTPPTSPSASPSWRWRWGVHSVHVLAGVDLMARRPQAGRRVLPISGWTAVSSNPKGNLQVNHSFLRAARRALVGGLAVAGL